MLWLCGVFVECEFLTTVLAEGNPLGGFPYIDLVTRGYALPPIFWHPEITAVDKIDQKINVAAEC